MSTEKKDYFDFVADVLGVKNILLSSTPVVAPRAVALLIAVESYLDYNSEEKDLLAKMIAALKMDLKLIQVCDLLDSANYQPELTLSFRDHFEKERHQSSPMVTTYSPRALLKNADNKKAAWAHLQQVIAHFKVTSQN
jgi:hypothetical protein